MSETEDTFRKIYVSDRFDFEMFAKLPSEVVVDEADISDFCCDMDCRYEDGDVIEGSARSSIKQPFSFFIQGDLKSSYGVTWIPGDNILPDK